MPVALLALAMSSSFFNPSFAFSSHFDPDGAPLSELSWSSSLAVVAVSFSGLFTVIVLMLACLCCKKGGIGFKEFENAEGDECVADGSAQGSPAAAAQNGPDVYVLPLTEVSLPMAKQPGRSVLDTGPPGKPEHPAAGVGTQRAACSVSAQGACNLLDLGTSCLQVPRGCYAKGWNLGSTVRARWSLHPGKGLLWGCGRGAKDCLSLRPGVGWGERPPLLTTQEHSWGLDPKVMVNGRGSGTLVLSWAGMGSMASSHLPGVGFQAPLPGTSSHGLSPGRLPPRPLGTLRDGMSGQEALPAPGGLCGHRGWVWACRADLERASSRPAAWAQGSMRVLQPPSLLEQRSLLR
ncbi:hypothetical protein GHT09_017474 [Marmota monax]|uniref:Serine/threonine-protein kinase LMTK1 n=1 Tax=Marmota monax TaxID=9995 RepID=A0A834UV58_MARMO|nr:hypothetical protein GHT09_017474 [Marmota monax]